MLVPSGATGATFSENKQFRFSLYRLWDASKEMVFFIMLNPSKAGALINDPTITRCVAFAKSWGFGGIWVGNLFPFRSTDPAELKRNPKPNQSPEYKKVNIEHLLEMDRKCTRTVFAWGNHGELFDRDKEIIKLFPWAHAFTLTVGGHPAHPLYLKGDSKTHSYQALLEHKKMKEATPAAAVGSSPIFFDDKSERSLEELELKFTKIPVLRIEFAAFGKDYVKYVQDDQRETGLLEGGVVLYPYFIEVEKICPTARIIRWHQTFITLQQFNENNFEEVIQWNKAVELLINENVPMKIGEELK